MAALSRGKMLYGCICLLGYTWEISFELFWIFWRDVLLSVHNNTYEFLVKGFEVFLEYSKTLVF